MSDMGFPHLQLAGENLFSSQHVLKVSKGCAAILMALLLLALQIDNVFAQPMEIFQDGFERVCPTYYSDLDQDGYGDPSTGQITCEEQPPDTVLASGDCNDSNKAINPGVADKPDLEFLDSNCDEIDGDIKQSVFLWPDGGNDDNDGLTPDKAVASLDVAFQGATGNNRSWILSSNGQTTLTGDFQEGKHISGGYNARNSWSRSSIKNLNVLVPSEGKLIDGWTLPTTWQLVSVRSHSNIGSSSIAIRVHNSSSLMFARISLISGDAGLGANGNGGSRGADGNTGKAGDDGVEDSLGVCDSNEKPLGGAGAMEMYCGGHAGGSGGDPGHEDAGGDDGLAGLPDGLGGDGGYGARTGGFAGETGDNGAAGNPGIPGLGGGEFGLLDEYGVYLPSDGQEGPDGQDGRGGGGGGGGGELI